MQIGYLADHQEFIPTLARWHHEEWAYLRPGDSVEARVERLRGSCGRQRIPTVVIAFADGALLGSAMLVANDMDTCLELSPWLAGVFVAPDHRRRNIGTALVQRIIADASQLGVRHLYLYTPSTEQFYSRLGWSLLEHTSYRGANVAVMRYDCAARQRDSRTRIQIRTCELQDFEHVVLLLRQLWPDKHLDVSSLQTVFARALATKTQAYFCATNGQQVVGFGSLTLKNNLWQEGCLGHIDELVVDREHQGHGIGTQLLNHLVAVAKQKGCKRVELDSAFHRTKAHEFYKRHGFEDRALLFSKLL